MIFAFTFSPSLTLNLVFILPAFLAVLTAFFLHEMAHKYMAIRFSCDAHFKLWPKGILLGLIIMFIPFITFVAPGATVVNPYRHGRWAFKETRLTVYELGMISFVGPAVNIVLALIFLPLSGIFVFSILMKVNAFLAFFNLLPIPPLDGSKIIIWKNWFWLIMIIISGALAFLI